MRIEISYKQLAHGLGNNLDTDPTSCWSRLALECCQSLYYLISIHSNGFSGVPEMPPQAFMDISPVLLGQGSSPIFTQLVISNEQ